MAYSYNAKYYGHYVYASSHGQGMFSVRPKKGLQAIVVWEVNNTDKAIQTEAEAWLRWQF